MKVTKFIIFAYGILISAMILIFTYVVQDIVKINKIRQNEAILKAVTESISVGLETYFQENLKTPKERKEVILSFWKTLINARIGKTGETYLVNEKGQLASPSRYDKELLGKKLVVPNTGTNIMLDELAAGRTGCQTVGYLDYRGVEVVGCWHWLEKYNIGVVSEIDKDEAYKTFRIISTASNAAAFASIILLLIGLYFVYKNIEGLFYRVNSEKEKAQAAEEKALEAYNIQKHFVSNISHEIRTPLNGLMGSISLMKDIDIPKEDVNLIETAENSTIVLKNLLNNILEISEIESDNIKLNIKEFELEDLKESITDLFEEELKEKKMNFLFEIDPDAPKRISSDPYRITQILSNIVSNAIKFTQSKGRVTVTVKSKAKSKDEEQLIIQVSDNGIGIHEENQSKIFEAFRQEDTSENRAHYGAGLGLTVTANLITLMNGSIDLKSEPSNGSTFTVKIPVKRVTDQLEPSIHEKQGNDVPKFENAKILLVEDNSTNILIATRYLKKLGAVPDVAKNGLLAVEATKEKRYDLIFMDIQMPVMNGIEATKNIIKEKGADAPPIIALTANAFNEDKMQYLGAGMKEIISKPFSKRDLKAALDKYIAA